MPGTAYTIPGPIESYNRPDWLLILETRKCQQDGAEVTQLGDRTRIPALVWAPET